MTEKTIVSLKKILEKNSIKKQVSNNNDGKIDSEYYVIRKVQDYFIPSITLSLALEYLHIKPEDVEVTLGNSIILKNPQTYDVDKSQLKPYRVAIKKDQYRTLNSINIPINEQGEMLINYLGKRTSDSGGSQTFPYFHYSGFASGSPGLNVESWPDSLALENKILMVGPFAQGMAEDEKLTPYGLMYGVEIHTNALNTILMNNFIQLIPLWQSLSLLFLSIMLVAFISSRLPSWLSLVLTFLFVFVYLIVALILFDNSAVLLPFGQIAFGCAFTFIIVIVYRALTEERDKRKIRSMFSKYVSSDVVTQMVELGTQPELGGVDKELTVLFSDIRGFTTLSESLTPQELVNHLNVYLTTMTDIIYEYRGTLDKYVGDEVMCFWGAPLDQSDHAILAAKCALRQMEALAELNAQWPENKRINIGIGLNSGIMTVGNMGSPGRMNYTLMGDNVNLGARLEGTNKEYGTNIIISEFTFALIKEKAIVRELDNIRVKGKNKPVLIYELLDFEGGFRLDNIKQK